MELSPATTNNSLRNNATYQIAFEKDGIAAFVPHGETEYHVSRFVAGQAQQRFAESGATAEVIEAIATQALQICNDKDVKTVRTDVGVLMNNLLYRLRYPVDELCAIRLGAVYCFLENEDPNKVEDFWTQKKVALALEDADWYAFFFTMGVEFTPSYKKQLNTLTDINYLMKRKQDLQALIPRTSIQ